MVTKLETQGKQIFQWGEKFVDIATLEKAVYEAVLSLGRNIMRQCIEEADRTLARQRDRGMYRDKGYRPTTLKTVMGEVGYQRHVYLLSGAAEQPRATVYLLDRSMGLDTVGLFSDTVCDGGGSGLCGESPDGSRHTQRSDRAEPEPRERLAHCPERWELGASPSGQPGGGGKGRVRVWDL